MVDTNPEALAAYTDDELTALICNSYVRNGTTHPDMHELLGELSRRHGIAKALGHVGPRNHAHNDPAEVARAEAEQLNRRAEREGEDFHTGLLTEIPLSPEPDILIDSGRLGPNTTIAPNTGDDLNAPLST